MPYLDALQNEKLSTQTEILLEQLLGQEKKDAEAYTEENGFGLYDPQVIAAQNESVRNAQNQSGKSVGNKSVETAQNQPEKIGENDSVEAAQNQSENADGVSL